MGTGEEVAAGSVWVCCGAEGWGSRGQASELTDFGDDIKTTHLLNVDSHPRVNETDISSGLFHVPNIIGNIWGFGCVVWCRCEQINIVSGNLILIYKYNLISKYSVLYMQT